MKKLAAALIGILWHAIVWGGSVHPYLRLDSHAHAGRVSAVAVDSAERICLTASMDKTAKVWHLPSGELLQTLYMPAGEGAEGALYAGALTPDGEIALTGGWTGCDSAGRCVVYIMNAGTGALVSRITALPGAVANIAIGPRGHKAAISLLGGHGVYCYDIRGPAPLGRLTMDGAHVYASCFDARGGLVTIDSRGFISRYDSALVLLEKATPLKGYTPYAVSIDRGAGLVAVGYQDTAAVALLDAQSMRIRQLLTAKRNVGAQTAIPAFDRTGKHLQVAFSTLGYDIAESDSLILSSWEIRDGRALPQSWTKAPGAGVASLTVLSDRSRLIGGAAPHLARIDPHGDIAFWRTGDDLLSSLPGRRRFWVSADGLEAGFDCESGIRVVFNAATGRIERYVVRRERERHYARTRRIVLRVDNRACVISANGKVITAVFADGSSAWRLSLQAPVRQLAAPRDRSIFAAALFDGTVRWFRGSDGAELAAVFMHRDGARWVCWSPEGAWDCAEGAESLLGIQFNRRQHRSSELFAVRRESSLGFTPGLMLNCLRNAVSSSRTKAPRMRADSIASMLPPSMTLVAPGSGALIRENPVTVWVRIVDGASSDIRLRGAVNGGPLDVAVRGLRVHNPLEQIKAIKVMLEPGPNRLYLQAENANGPGKILGALLTYARDRTGVIAGRTLGVLAIGVSNYHESSWRLDYAASDAAAFSRALEAQEGGLYESVRATALTDEQASRAEVVAALERLSHELDSSDILAVYFAGHMVRDSAGDHFFATVDSDPDSLAETALSARRLAAMIGDTKATALAFIDACHAGAMGEAYQRTLRIASQELASKAPERIAALFLSSRNDERSQERRSLQSGVFTHALLKGLQGAADYTGEGKITVAMLDLYVSQHVPILSGGGQTPIVMKPAGVPDFTLALLPENQAK